MNSMYTIILNLFKYMFYVHNQLKLIEIISTVLAISFALNYAQLCVITCLNLES